MPSPPPSPTPPPGSRQPRQARSVRTAERILAAARDLLAGQEFDRVSVPAIATRAGCSVGAFYGRFRDKEALLEALDEQYVSGFAACLETAWDGAGRRPASLEPLVRATVAALVEYHREHAGLARTLVLRARGGPAEGYRAREQRLHALLPRFARLVRETGATFAHPRPDRAVSLATLTVLFTLREIVLWPHLAQLAAVRDETLVGELTRLFLAYVGAARPAGRRSGRSRP